MLSVLTLALCAGIFLAPYTPWRCTHLWGTAVIVWCANLFFLKRQRISLLILIALAVLLGALLFKNSQLQPSPHLGGMYFSSQELYTVEGVVVSEPLFRYNRSEFVFFSEALQHVAIRYSCRGKILTYFSGRFDPEVGSKFILTGTLWHPFPKRGTRQKSYTEYLHQQGISAVMNVRLPPEGIGLSRKYWLPRYALWIKHKIESIFNRYLSPLSASVAEAMVLGDKKDIPPLLYQQMIYSGTVHILAGQYTKLPAFAF